MKELKTKEEIEMISHNKNYLIEYGVPDTCIPCQMTKDNLETFEKDSVFDLQYYYCTDVDIMTELGYTSIPVVELITENNKIILTDSSISMDEDELKDWIKGNIGE